MQKGLAQKEWQGVQLQLAAHMSAALRSAGRAERALCFV